MSVFSYVMQDLYTAIKFGVEISFRDILGYIAPF